GLGIGLVALTVVAYGIFKLGRKLPIKTFLSWAVVLLMATSVAFLGNAVRSLQEADVLGLTALHGWPKVPIFLSQALGYWPSRETMLSQAVLTAIYLGGAFYMFVLRRPAPKPAAARVPVAPESEPPVAPSSSAPAPEPAQRH
ncbi:MAG: hypothetical protein LC792_17005, partial [Actinobacteria bacterium]|nr:hypothetical protein [Actinomycetota bacterium]